LQVLLQGGLSSVQGRHLLIGSGGGDISDKKTRFPVHAPEHSDPAFEPAQSLT